MYVHCIFHIYFNFYKNYNNKFCHLYIKKSAEINDISQEVLNINIRNINKNSIVHKEFFFSKCNNLPQKFNQEHMLRQTSFQEMYAQRIFQKSTDSDKPVSLNWLIGISQLLLKVKHHKTKELIDTLLKGTEKCKKYLSLKSFFTFYPKLIKFLINFDEKQISTKAELKVDVFFNFSIIFNLLHVFQQKI